MSFLLWSIAVKRSRFGGFFSRAAIKILGVCDEAEAAGALLDEPREGLRENRREDAVGVVERPRERESRELFRRFCTKACRSEREHQRGSSRSMALSTVTWPRMPESDAVAMS